MLYGDIQGIANPWRFANRPEIASLSLFTHRFYNPRLMRWQTTDPLGFEEGLNLYAYVHNNPFCYKDPDGRFVIAIPLLEVAFGSVLTVSFLPAIGTAVACSVVCYAMYELAEYTAGKINDQRMHKDDLEDDAQNTKEIEKEREKKKLEGVYGPDRKLPRDKYGNPIPEVNEPHTQLGKEPGRKGKYIQAREFDNQGMPIRDIDFTDHGRPLNHPNPHQHRYIENQTGGTLKRHDPEPLPEWEY